jgi:uncharacterized protein YbjT (DUF2867 family)
MRASVTRSTGLLGNNLVRTLIDAGHEVWALARSTENSQREVGDTAARVVLGDIRNVATFAYELRGIDAIFHTATHTVSPMSVEAMRMMNACLHVTSAKAEKQLSATFRSFSATLADTVSWAQTRVQRKRGRSAPAL